MKWMMTIVAALLLGAVAFSSVKAWRGETVWFPGINALMDQVKPRPAAGDEGQESDDDTLAPTEEDSLNEEILKNQQEAFKAVGERLNVFKVKVGDEEYFLADSAERYDALAKALTPFSRKVSPKALLKEAAGKKDMPLFFNFFVDFKVEEIGGISQLVPELSITAAKTREEVAPLPEAGPTRLVIGQVLGAGGSDFKTLDEFVKAFEKDLTNKDLKGGDSPLKIRLRLENQIKNDLQFFGAQVDWRPIVAQMTWEYASKTSAEHVPNLVFLPYHVEWQVSTRKVHRKQRQQFATTAGIDAERLEAEITSFAEKNRVQESVWVTYMPNTDELSLNASRSLTVVSTLVKNTQTKWEFDQVGGYVLTPGQGLMHLIQKMYEDLGVQELPAVFVRKELYNKSGGRPPVVMYEHQLTAFPIGTREMVTMAIEDLLDQGASEWYLFGCKQTREEINALYSAYASSQESPLPCEVVYDHLNQKVVRFQSTAPEVKTAYFLQKLTEETLSQKKEEIKADHGIALDSSLSGYRAGLEEAIKAAKFDVSLDEEGNIKGGLLAFIVVPEENRVAMQLVDPKTLK